MFGKIAGLLYGVVCYLLGVASLVYFAAWLIGLVPQALDAERSASLPLALATNLTLVVMFALQHSGMARPRFKSWWTQWVPAAMERSTYVLASALAMGLFFWFWEPMGVVLWSVESTLGLALVYSGFAVGWVVLFAATFCIDHFDLFGLRQVWLNARNLPYAQRSFMTRGLYRLVRHPIYLGWMLIVWIAPIMTLSHLLFALLLTVYTLCAVRLEERDLVAALPEYAAYRKAVPMILPSVARPLLPRGKSLPGGKSQSAGEPLSGQT